MSRSQFGMTASESFIQVTVDPVKDSDSPEGDVQSSGLENTTSIQTISSSAVTSSYLDISSEETAKWSGTLSGRKRSSLFADVRTLEEDGGCSVAYEYLCRLEELRRYLGTMLNVNPSLLPSTLAFEHQLSNGVWLCQLLAEVLPEKEITNSIFDLDHDTYKEEGLVFRHEHNIRLFLELITDLSFPVVLMPTIEEVFESENRIKLVYTAQALAYYLKEIGLTNQRIDNLEKYLQFDEQVLLEIITMLESKGLDLPSFECLRALVDDELIYQALKLKKSADTRTESTSSQEKSYMTMKPKKEGEETANSDPENHYSNQSMERNRRSGTHDVEHIYEDADKIINSESVSESKDSVDSTFDPTDSGFYSPTKSEPIPRRRKLSRGRMSALTGWNSAQLFMFPSRLEFNLFACKESSIRVCMYTKPKIDMIIPTSPRKGVPLNLKPLLEKLKQAVMSNNTQEVMNILNNKHLQVSPLDVNKSQLYIDALKQELEDSLNKCALAIYYGMKKAQSEKYLAVSEQGSYLLRVGKKSPPTLSLSFRSKRGIKHFKIQYKSSKLSLKKRDVIRHEYNFSEDLIRELIDFLQDAHKLELFPCAAPDLSINPDIKDCNYFTSLSLDKVQFCINAINSDIKKIERSPSSYSWAPLKENPYTGLWGREMIIPVDRFASELLLIQYGTIGSYVVRPKGDGPMSDYVISIRTGTDVTHVKVDCVENGGYSLPSSNDVAPNLEQFVEAFTFKESQQANIALKPVRIPSVKIEELKRKDEQRRGNLSDPLLTSVGTKSVGLKKGRSLDNLINDTSPQFPHATMVTSTSGYEGDTDSLETVPPTPPSPFSDKIFTTATSSIDLSTKTIELPNLSAGSPERSVSLYGIKRSTSIPKDSIQSVNSIPSFAESLESSESLSSPILSQKQRELESSLRQTPVQQRKSVLHTPLPPVPNSSPMPVNKLTQSVSINPCCGDFGSNSSPPPVPLRPHALSMSSNVTDSYNDIRRQQKGIDGLPPEDKLKRPRPRSIKVTRTVNEFTPPMPSSVSNMDFSTQFRSETDLTRFRKISAVCRPTQPHVPIERKISANLFLSRPTLPEIEDKPTPQLSPELLSEEDAFDIDTWDVEEVGKWLEEIGLGQYQQTFADNDIDGSVLSMLTNENLRDDIGIQSFGHRSKIIKQVKKLQT